MNNLNDLGEIYITTDKWQSGFKINKFESPYIYFDIFKIPHVYNYVKNKILMIDKNNNQCKSTEVNTIINIYTPKLELY